MVSSPPLSPVLLALAPLLLHLLHSASADSNEPVACPSGRATCPGSGLAECWPAPEKDEWAGIHVTDEWIRSCRCQSKCLTCDGPGEYDCRTCAAGYCMEDRGYRERHYGGTGKCWDLMCPTPPGQDAPEEEGGGVEAEGVTEEKSSSRGRHGGWYLYPWICAWLYTVAIR
mmetsp:Transcript_13351/g.32407  ORF Transcript_13351/g.32407 Transcript_13351/m.32407 type:complete len:171 (+) Transcript_13351:132-644(+)|eukprot:CAMPEP_0181117974 /NCGR_PEP_ID=MMETSP1071-20121207/22825_1 /TAXON_ID=35127 /ORGANISM="Thalassiosira sp., Strain NH16" /LENGTH=170 /DNA_ID=CAMNT_0023202431 /DNA_START=119 /DNA_END=631 /DNA_ORIENTATION=+